jgi:hypothetical protein
MFNAEPLQVGLVLLQPLYGFVAFHKNKHNKTEGPLPRLSPCFLKVDQRTSSAMAARPTRFSWRLAQDSPPKTVERRLGSFRKKKLPRFSPLLLWQLPKAYTWFSSINSTRGSPLAQRPELKPSFDFLTQNWVRSAELSSRFRTRVRESSESVFWLKLLQRHLYVQQFLRANLSASHYVFVYVGP